MSEYGASNERGEETLLGDPAVEFVKEITAVPCVVCDVLEREEEGEEEKEEEGLSALCG